MSTSPRHNQDTVDAIKLMVIGSLLCDYGSRLIVDDTKQTLKYRIKCVMNAVKNVEMHFLNHPNTNEYYRQHFKKAFNSNETVLLADLILTCWAVEENGLEEIISAIKQVIEEPPKTMPLTKEQLLQKRFKLVQKYPGAQWEVGDIFECVSAGLYMGSSFPVFRINESVLEEYQNIFQPLPWWSDRHKHELPEYVIWKEGEPKVQSAGFDFDTDTIWLDGYQHTLSMWIDVLDPSTEEEYTTYINQKQ